MQVYLIGSLIFAFIVALFALWNSTEAVICFPLIGEFTTSLALVIIGSAMLGALVVAILGLVNYVKTKIQINKYLRTIKEHEATIDRLQKQLKNHEEAGEQMTPEFSSPKEVDNYGDA